MGKLSDKKCTPCHGDKAPLAPEVATDLYNQLQDRWDIEENHHLERTFSFKDFDHALRFVNDVGRIAEEEGHHPEMHLKWGEVKVTLFTRQ
jgi:4a-hydroxytetrahydrobiopterin dehydratase